MKKLTVCGVIDYPDRKLVTKELGTLPLTEGQYQKICAFMGVITKEMQETLKGLKKI